MVKTHSAVKNTNIFYCEKCDFTCSKKSDWARHIIRPKHLLIKENPQQKTPKFCCEKCYFTCSKPRDFERHIVTPKHLRMLKKPETAIENTTHICSRCKKSYQYSSGLWKHSKNCKVEKTNEIIAHTTGASETGASETGASVTGASETDASETDASEIDASDIIPTEKNFMELLIKDNSEIKNIVLDMVKSNTELLIKENTEFKNIILDMVKSNTELQKQMLDVCKSNSNINTNTNINCNNNSNNKTFNLQFFLNEQCKDAMNITDFANSFELQLSDLECVGELGYVEGITKIMIDKLNSMDVYKRPIHCSDAKREIIYVKDADVWAKEEKDNPKLRQAIKNVSFKNMKLVYNWSNAYPESKDNQTKLNDKYMMLVIESTGGKGPILESENKIIRRIAKEILIDKTKF
jgi:hypothetical protein